MKTHYTSPIDPAYSDDPPECILGVALRLHYNYFFEIKEDSGFGNAITLIKS